VGPRGRSGRVTAIGTRLYNGYIYLEYKTCIREHLLGMSDFYFIYLKTLPQRQYISIISLNTVELNCQKVSLATCQALVRPAKTHENSH
jgi:hypothetical protein